MHSYKIVSNKVELFQTKLSCLIKVIHSLDCDEMHLLWPNDSLILSFYYISFDRKLNWTTFVNEAFLSDA